MHSVAAGKNSRSHEIVMLGDEREEGGEEEVDGGEEREEGGEEVDGGEEREEGGEEVDGGEVGGSEEAMV